jgi:hypothetical protein
MHCAERLRAHENRIAGTAGDESEHRMDDGYSQDAPPSGQIDHGQNTTEETLRPPLHSDDAPPSPGLPWQGDAAEGDPDADTQPIRGTFGHRGLPPQWPLERPAPRRSDALGREFGLGVAMTSLIGGMLVLALVIGILFVVRGGGAPSFGEASEMTAVAGTPSSTAVGPVSTATLTSTQHAGVPTAPTPQLTAVPTQKPAPKATPIPPPRLRVSPQQATGNCTLGQYPALVVTNSGGGQLTWAASTSDLLVHATPASGTLAAGQSRSVTLSGIHIGKTWTVTFSGNGGGATVTITCG